MSEMTREEAIAKIREMEEVLSEEFGCDDPEVEQAIAALSSCACGGGNVLADGLLNGWVGEREGNLGMLNIIVDYDSVGVVQLDKHVRIVEVEDDLPAEGD